MGGGGAGGGTHFITYCGSSIGPLVTLDVPRARKGSTEEPLSEEASAAREAETVVREDRMGVSDAVWATPRNGALDEPDSSTVMVKGGSS